jgi:hypothetical protein
MSKLKYTKTSTFIFPLLNIPKKLFYCDVTNIFNKPILSNRFINAYLINPLMTKYNYLEGFITVHINNHQDIHFKAFYDTLGSLANYVEDYEVNDNLFFVFKIEDVFINDYHILLQVGAGYSLIKKEAKSIILKNYFFHGEPSHLPLILNKSTFLRDSWNERLNCDIGEQEVWGMIQPHKETLDVSKIIKKLKTIEHE